MIYFGSRCLKVFFRDRASVFFSLLAVFVIIGLYALFLGDVWVASYEQTGLSGVRYMMDSWIMAGLLAVTSITTTMGAYGIMVEDRAKKTVKDFTASPVTGVSIIGGYIISAVLIGIIMSLVAAVLSEIYIVASGGELMSALTALKVVGLIALCTIANSSLILFMVSFFKSSNAFVTASTLIGTMIGFLTGIYLPIGQLPEAVQWVVKCFPVSHAAALFRQVMMEDAMSTSFSGLPEETAASFREEMGVVFSYGGYEMSAAGSVLVLAASAAVFYTLALLNISRKSK